MTQGRELATREERQVAIQGAPQALAISPEYVETTKRSLSLLRGLTKELLEPGRDYGRVPGIPIPFLWDPGASLIISGFNCHVGARRIMSLIQDGKKISVVVEVPILNNQSGLEVASGVGAASTLEVKHKYRWEKNPQDFGYNDEAIATMKTKQSYGETVYRILNPEHDELLNTIVKIASKRGETDAAESLPGVASALRELFQPAAEDNRATRGRTEQKAGNEQLNDDSPHWTAFWTQAKALGYDSTQAHKVLGVASMKDWLSKGHSLDDGIAVLTMISKGTALDEALKSLTEKRSVQRDNAAGVAPVPKKTQAKWDLVTKANVSTYDELEMVFKALTGQTDKQMYASLGGGNRNSQTITPWEAFLTLKELYCQKE